LICAALEGVLFAVFGLGFVARSNRLLESGELFFGMPETLTALAWIPVVHAVLAAALLIAVVFAWRRRWWDRVRRVLFTVSAALAALQVIFLIHWNYLPIVW
jgi:hypothetical protein